ncbi:MAG: bacillithiol biosynthesis cysteine-adding enzyme BshC [Bacteroidota bacterium]|nr:bacillithiol biosynthesis cysteine-adding enzyme BshC [Bacteroidota bacterium]
MDWKPTLLSYRQTGYFSKIITDYLDQADTLRPFYEHPANAGGIMASIKARQGFRVNRPALVDRLRRQYEGVHAAAPVQRNIEALLDEEVFTVCTAHQPAIFTGSLYFIYKILHCIRLATKLGEDHPGKRFVPVFYMGSEDADLEELGKVYLHGEKLEWDTKQKGAVGRMSTKGLEPLFHRIEGELSVQPFGAELVGILREAYLESPDIQTATFRLLHHLFSDYGLVVLNADDVELKRLMIPVFEDDLFRNIPSRIVEETTRALSQHVKVQANPRMINLFYLKDDLRGRIEKRDGVFYVHESSIVFSEEELREELHRHPERFSPNVILRGLFQETLLPNIAFIGGGGETAYWLELKDLFRHYGVPYPVLVMRNSFLLVEAQWTEKLERAGLSAIDVFRAEDELMNELVKRQSTLQLSLEKEIGEAQSYYTRLKQVSAAVDPTLVQHVDALETKALEPVRELEKKLLKAEKRKFKDQQRQIHAIQTSLFPLNSLQERVDNFMPWYARHGRQFLKDLYDHSLTLEQQFVVLQETV